MQDNSSIAVLVAEDDYFVAETVKLELAKVGLEVAGEAANGQQAVEMTSALRPDVVLMDINMPVFDGLEATRRIQKLCPTPVVILTAYDMQDLVEEASDVGVSAYLTKPTNAQDIERAVKLALARHGDLMELRRLNAELEAALAEIKTLRGIIPICSSCKKIRDDSGSWQQLERYIHDHTDAVFSHGLCQTCARELYPDLELSFLDKETEDDR